MEQSKQVASGVNRRARTSAAMIGLALSMGGASLLLPRQNDGAAAAEAQPTDTVAAAEAQVVGSSSPAAQPERMAAPSVPSGAIAHKVRQGQTLWQLAQRYQVGAQAIAQANGLPDNAVLQVGQMLVIPAASAPQAVEVVSVEREAARPVQPAALEPTQPEIAGSTLLSVGADSQLKADQDDALEQMRQKREKLKAGLSELRSEPAPAAELPKEQPEASAIAPTTVAPSPAVTSVPPAAPVEVPQIPQAAAPVVPAEPELTHQVKPGETLDAIAHAYDVSRQSIASANQLSDPDWLRINQSLVIPQADEPAEPSTVSLPLTPQPEASAPGSTVYRVNSGDTVVEIARRYNIPQMAIVEANRLDNPHLIVVNQELMIPTLESSARQSDLIAAVPPAPAVAEEQATASQVPALVPTVSEAAEPASQMYTAVAVPTVPVSDDSSNIAAVPPARSSEPSAESASSEAVVASRSTPTSQHYVEGLMAEILSMRDRYQQQSAPQQALTAQPQRVAAASPTPAVVEVPSESDTAVNPEFRPDEAAATAEPEQRRSVLPAAPAPEATPAQPEAPQARSDRQLVAAAPLGSENYAPLIQPITGQMVSPDLPPLPAADAYLPEGAPVFDGYRWPTRGTLTSGYGWRWGRMHRGIDIGAPTGTPVVAAASGEVVFAGWNSGGYGNMVDIRHADGSMTRYAHNSRLLVRRGQQVEQGELISEVGSTGYSTGPHLHFEVHLPNRGTVNPIALLPSSRD